MKLNEHILSWEMSSEDPKFLILMINNTFWKEVYKSLFQKHLSQLRRSLSLEENFALLEQKICKAEAFRLLGLRGRCSKELKEKLLLKKFSQEAIDVALQECQHFGFLNDEEEQILFVSRLQKKGYGKALIAAKVRARGMVFSGNLPEDQVSVICQLLQKKYQNTPKEKVIAALCRRGFDYSTIIDALNSGGSYKKRKG
jgi:regulatory protein